MTDLKKGARVRLSDRAQTKRRSRVGRMGTVSHTPRRESWGLISVAVRWDGNATFEYVPADWLDLEGPRAEVLLEAEK